MFTHTNPLSLTPCSVTSNWLDHRMIITLAWYGKWQHWLRHEDVEVLYSLQASWCTWHNCHWELWGRSGDDDLHAELVPHLVIWESSSKLANTNEQTHIACADVKGVNSYCTLSYQALAIGLWQQNTTANAVDGISTLEPKTCYFSQWCVPIYE